MKKKKDQWLPEEGKKVLLHTCCAPCSGAIVEYLVQRGIRPVIFYSNSNITPRGEYDKRLNECIRYAEKWGLEIVDDDYDHKDWLCISKGLEKEPERGLRCLECFRYRLTRAAMYASRNAFDYLATTLASSRWKDLSQVDSAGRLAVSSLTEGKDAPPKNASLRSAPPLASQSEAPVPPLNVPRVAVFSGGASFPSTTPEEVIWWGQNWRKGGMQERRNFLIKSCALYNQTWCGCEFSARKES